MGRPTQQEIDDARNAGKTDEAYAKSLTVTEQAPAPAQKASVPKPPVVKKAKGGSIDGMAQRGKTRGKIC